MAAADPCADFNSALIYMCGQKRCSLVLAARKYKLEFICGESHKTSIHCYTESTTVRLIYKHSVIMACAKASKSEMCS